jgi:hypothetical protein
MTNKKAQGISINMIVVIAIAVFVVFLVLGFASGGWNYFAGAFGSATKGTGGYEAAKIKCDTWCTSYQGGGCPDSGYLYNRMYNEQGATADTDGNGALDDCFSCLGDTVSCDGEKIPNVLGGKCDCAAGVDATDPV